MSDPASRSGRTGDGAPGDGGADSDPPGGGGTGRSAGPSPADLALREAYGRRIAAQIGAVRETWDELGQRPWDVDSLRALQVRVHRLAGAGATAGLVEVDRMATSLERMLKEFGQVGIDTDGQRRAGIDDLLVELERACEEGDRGGPLPFPSRPPTVSSSSPSETPAAGKLVYLVTESAAEATAIAAQVRPFGYAVRPLGGPEELTAAIAEHRPDAVVIDVVFPGRDGVPSQDRRAVQRFRHAIDQPVPVIFVSDRDDLAVRLEAVRVGGQFYFRKPVDAHLLADKLDALTAADEPDPLRILIVEDDPPLAVRFAQILEQAGMVTRTVSEPLDVLDPLTAFGPDLILMDVYMEGCNGLELARVIRQMEQFDSIPIVFLSGEANRDRQLAAIRSGGDDFLTKPIQPGHLISSVVPRAERARQLRSYMVVDGLTGLVNHTRLKDELEFEAARARRSGEPLAFALIDLDHFKRVNDEHGHGAGDSVLKSLSRLLKRRLRKYDTVGRYGGEEFGVVLPKTDGATAVQLLDGLREDFGRLRHIAGGEPFRSSFSAGVAVYPPCRDAATLVALADQALYRAKDAGRDRIELAVPGTDPESEPESEPGPDARTDREPT